MGVLSKWLLGIDAQKTFDTISGGIDKLNFSNQERANLNVQLADKVADYAEKTLSENTIRSKARRLIAYVVVFAYIGLVLVSLFIDSEYLHSLVINSPIQTAFIMVLAFFFGGYYLKNFELKGKK